MKNRKASLSVILASYNISLQITNVVVDSTTGLTTAAKAWTNFIDSSRSSKEYSNSKWTLDEWSTNPAAVEAVDQMIDIIMQADAGQIDKPTALTQFKQKHDIWLAEHRKNNSNFIEKEVAGINCTIGKADLCAKVMQFFQDVPDFQVGARFLNTLMLAAQNGGRQAEFDFINGYFKLQGQIDSAESLIAKMGGNGADSPEWDTIEAGLCASPMKKQINERLKIYFGAKGTGKTVTAMSELQDKSDVIVCNAAMDANDLMFDFDFKDGKPLFKPSKMFLAAEQGKPFLLDEINLLNDDVLRFLQGITDTKEEFSIKGYTVHVKPGFMVIGTMNLMLSGRVYPLPEPLVDRAFELKEFKLDANDLANLI